MSAQQLPESVHDAAAAHVGPDATPGLAILIAHGDELYAEAMGELTIGGDSVKRDSLFRIASISKPITAATMLTLVSDGLIGLDDAVDRWLPELAEPRVLMAMDGPLGQTVPAARAITVRDLLTFTFGFGFTLEMFSAQSPWPVAQAATELGLASLGPLEPATPPDPDTWIERFGTLPLMAQPGQRWFYNTSAQVLSVLISRVAGRPLPEVMHERIFAPLGMRDTTFHTSSPERLATCYRHTADGLIVWDHADGLWASPHPFPDGAGGLLSTLDDLQAFSQMLLGGGDGLLNPELILQMTTGQLTPAQRARSSGLAPDFFKDMSWGFCQAVHADGSFGWDGGLGTSWLVDPGKELVVIVFTQRMFDSPDSPQVHKDVRRAAYAALGASDAAISVS